MECLLDERDARRPSAHTLKSVKLRSIAGMYRKQLELPQELHHKIGHALRSLVLF